MHSLHVNNTMRDKIVCMACTACKDASRNSTSYFAVRIGKAFTNHFAQAGYNVILLLSLHASLGFGSIHIHMQSTPRNYKTEELTINKIPVTHLTITGVLAEQVSSLSRKLGVSLAGLQERDLPSFVSLTLDGKRGMQQVCCFEAYICQFYFFF